MKQAMFTLLKSARTNGVRSTLDFTNFAVLRKITSSMGTFSHHLRDYRISSNHNHITCFSMPLTSLTYAVAIEN